VLEELGVAVNDQSAIASSVDPVGQIHSRLGYTEFAHTVADVGSAEMFQQSTHQIDDHLRLWPLWLRGQELGGENGQNTEFMTAFSHELRTSLCTIRSAVGTLRMETSTRSAALTARTVIERQVAQMTRLVEDLLDVSRISRGQLALRPERVDLCAVASHAAQTVAFAMQEHRHCLSTSFPDAPVWLQADPARLEQVFVNLLFNAAKYTKPGGRIRLSAAAEQGKAVVCIRNSGIGIEPKDLPHVFALFAEADPSPWRAEAGMGIELALVRTLVERHGGRVTASSAGRGHGSEFTVRLPCEVAAGSLESE
jgi:signal transduction histidine kinase